MSGFRVGGATRSCSGDAGAIGRAAGEVGKVLSEIRLRAGLSATVRGLAAGSHGVDAQPGPEQGNPGFRPDVDDTECT